MSVAVQEDTGSARSLGPRLLGVVDRAGPPARRRGMGGVYLAIIALAVLAGALSLRLPSTPNYDPWVWLIWGREIVHGQLSTTGGPTLKPLAMVFTTIVAPFGSAAPNMWVAIARAGGLTALALTFLLTARLSRSVIVGRVPGAGWALPGLAGLGAAAGLFVLPQFVYVVAQGYSEGVLLSVVLLAVLRHLDGAPRQTQLLLFAASLDRPEMWPPFILYGLWQWRIDRRARPMIICLAAAIPVIWLVPDLIGSGSLLRGAEYASYPRGAGTSSCPFCTEVTSYEWPLIRTPYRIGVLLALVPGMVELVRAARRGRGVAAAPTAAPQATDRADRRLDIAVCLLLVAGLGLFVEDAVLTELKFSGNGRYLFAGACLLIIVAMVGWARIVACAFMVAARWRGRVVAAACAGVMTAIAAAAVAPSAVHAVGGLSSTWSGLRFQARLRGGLDLAVRQAGGAATLRACGTVQTNPQLAPIVAWTLHETIGASEATRGPVIIRGRADADAAAEPKIPHGRGWHVVARSQTITIATRC